MPGVIVGRYEIFQEIASGGTATVFIGRLRGGSGFSRTVAVKRLRAHLAHDPDFVAMFLDEARVAGRIRHPNVVSTLDVVKHDGELFLVMDYVHGESLAGVRRTLEAQGRRFPLAITGAIVMGVLEGLHAAHEAMDEKGMPLGVVHRDVSPQNVLVGADGVARVVDFGIAKAAGRAQTTAGGQVKGKVAYMAPEQMRGSVDRRTDVFATSVVLWELLAGRRLFAGETPAETLANAIAGRVPSLRALDPALSEALEELVMAGLDPSPERRFATAREMAQALSRAIPVASSFDVAEWLKVYLGETLEERASVVTAIESAGATPLVRAPLASEEATSEASMTIAPRGGWRRATRVLVASFLASIFVLVFVGRRVSSSAVPPEAPIGALGGGEAAPGSSDVSTPSSPASAAVVSRPSAAATDTGHTTWKPRAASAAPAVRKLRTSCDPPFWIDDRGKHFKDECL